MHYSNGNMNAEINIKNNKIILYGKTILHINNEAMDKFVVA